MGSFVVSMGAPLQSKSVYFPTIHKDDQAEK